MIANLLHNAMGVKMGDRFLGRGPWNHHGVWEDLDFVQMNKKLLHRAGAVSPVWRHPPNQAEIDFQARIIPTTVWMRSVIYRKAALRWGWKDPRTCLTIGLYAPHLLNPIYIVTHRDEDHTIKSLEKRGHKRGDAFWRNLIRRYESTRDTFLEDTDRPVVHIQFERLTSKKSWRDEVARIEEAARVEVDEQKARGIIEWR